MMLMHGAVVNDGAQSYLNPAILIREIGSLVVKKTAL